MIPWIYQNLNLFCWFLIHCLHTSLDVCQVISKLGCVIITEYWLGVAIFLALLLAHWSQGDKLTIPVTKTSRRSKLGKALVKSNSKLTFNEQVSVVTFDKGRKIAPSSVVKPQKSTQSMAENSLGLLKTHQAFKQSDVGRAEQSNLRVKDRPLMTSRKMSGGDSNRFMDMGKRFRQRLMDKEAERKEKFKNLFRRKKKREDREEEDEDINEIKIGSDTETESIHQVCLLLQNNTY